jgi:hypothetical protein
LGSPVCTFVYWDALIMRSVSSIGTPAMASDHERRRRRPTPA